jgi:REP element-mobilizing transposase RayT
MTDFVRGSSSLFRLEAQAAASIGVEITELGYDRDHIHLDVRWMRITLSVDQIAKELKGATGRKLLREFPGIKRRLFWGSGLWSPVIYGDSMGREPAQLRDYIRDQGRESKKHETSLKRFFNLANYPKRA